MSLLRYLLKNRKAKTDQSSMENDTTAPYNLSGRDSLGQESESSFTNTIRAKKSNVANADYSKRLSGSLPNSHLCGFF